MYIVLGATGHVGSAVAATLLDANLPVTVVTRDAAAAADLRGQGARVVEADVCDTDALRAIFTTGRRAFLLNPPADVSRDTDACERRTARCILDALDGSGLEKVVAESTYGAQPGRRCGDLTVLHEFEEGLRDRPILAAIIRAAYYYSNWDASLDDARDTGVLTTMAPADLPIPMVSPVDIGRQAARLLRAPVDVAGITYVEGPARYSAEDVADAFERALGRRVRPAVTPRSRWEDAYRSLGFSHPAAANYTRMTGAVVDGAFAMPTAPVRGTVTIEDHVAELLTNAAEPVPAE